MGMITGRTWKAVEKRGLLVNHSDCVLSRCHAGQARERERERERERKRKRKSVCVCQRERKHLGLVHSTRSKGATERLPAP